MKVLFSSRGTAAPPVEAPARRGIEAVMRRHRVRSKGELNVVWVSRRELRKMGKKFRGADRFTDVISFRYEDPLIRPSGAPSPKRGRKRFSLSSWPLPRGTSGWRRRERVAGGRVRGDAVPFGDLFISPEQARVNARRFGVPYREECVRLCVHGALHLLDYRDYTSAEKTKMWSVQEPIVKKAAR